MPEYRLVITLITDVDCDDQDDAQTVADHLAENITWPEVLHPADDVEIGADVIPFACTCSEPDYQDHWCPQHGDPTQQCITVVGWGGTLIRQLVQPLDHIIDAEVLDDEHPFGIGQHVRRVGNPWFAREWIVVDKTRAHHTVVRNWDTTIEIRNEDYEVVPFLWPQDTTGRQLAIIGSTS